MGNTKNIGNKNILSKIITGIVIIAPSIIGIGISTLNFVKDRTQLPPIKNNVIYLLYIN